MKTKKKELIKVGKSKHNVSKYNPLVNAWKADEDKLVADAFAKSDNMVKTSKKLSQIINRTPEAIRSRYYILKNKEAKQIKLDLSFIGSKKPLFIPKEIADNLFMEEVQVLMFKAMDGSLHEKASDAVKANIRTILDSYDEVRDSKNVDDKDLHQWFLDNKSKVEYMLNINSEELW